MAGLESVPSDLNGSAAYRTRVGAAMVARAWTRACAEARDATDVPVQVTVNGRARVATVEPRQTLADFLREDCQLTGHAPRVRARRVRRVHGARSTVPPCARA